MSNHTKKKLSLAYVTKSIAWCAWNDAHDAMGYTLNIREEKHDII